MKRAENNRNVFFQPPERSVKKKPLKEDLLLKNALWERYEEKLKNSLRDELGQEPTKEDVENAFQDLIETMKEQGLLNKILDIYLDKKIADQRQKAGLS